LVVPVICTASVEKTHSFNKAVRTKIDSPYFKEAFSDLITKFNAVARFEANGGFLLASSILIESKELFALPTRVTFSD
tara:strand:+ start:11174 stop:11407 length:234 start_codon:yes stop_codon:yes gene_type:complete